MGGDFAADDFAPARHQFGGRKTLARKRLAHDLADQFAQRLGDWARGLVHETGLCHACRTMAAHATLAAKTAGRQRGKGPAAVSSPQPTELLAWYDRHHRK